MSRRVDHALSIHRAVLQGAACRRVVQKWMNRALSTPRDMFRPTLSR